MTRPGSREGFALAGVVLAMALLMAFALTALTAGRRQVVVGGEGLDWIQARIVAESGVRLFLQGAEGPSPVAPGSALLDFRTGTLGGRPWTASLVRMGSEHHAVILRARLRGRDVGASVARAIWWLSPGARVSTSRASLEVGDLGGSEIPVTGAPPTDDALAEAGSHPACRGRPDLGSAPMPLTGVGPLPEPPDWGDPPSWGTAHGIRLGRLEVDHLQELANVHISGAVSLSACPTCWMGLVLADAGTEIAGSGAGLLVALGDLRLAPAATWDGMVLVGGNLEMAPATTVTGLVRVSGRVVLLEDATVVPSGCAAYGSILATPGIQRPMPVGVPSWVGPISPG
ncbi:MAG: hypothetical protein HKO53_02495 [Gemmatimonadetes bacterium]|nr:hypothetical protein [Gemmatimonadota bacterium]